MKPKFLKSVVFGESVVYQCAYIFTKTKEKRSEKKATVKPQQYHTFIIHIRNSCKRKKNTKKNETKRKKSKNVNHNIVFDFLSNRRKRV